jgi:3-dehydroquinate synthase
MRTEQFKLHTKRSNDVSITLGSHVLDVLSDDLEARGATSVAVIADSTVWRIHGLRIGEILQRGGRTLIVQTVAAGEISKSWEQAGVLLDGLLRSGVRRGTPMVAIGGGVVGDLAGFIASACLRGLPLIQVPTTLLAMVDSSIGGKTGVNHATGKNLIGAFYQPERIVMDTELLTTLPEREWRCGLGEVLKYGMISDPALLDVDYASETVDWPSIISKSARFKARTVEEDELELGIRAYLNYGHTFGHALETVTHFTRFAHGEAVYIGMIAAAKFGQLLGHRVDPDVLLRHASLFKLNTQGMEERIPELMSTMFMDKKIKGSAIRFIFVDPIGSPFIQELDAPDLIESSWRFALRNA